MSNPATPFIPPQVATLLAAHRKIEAIKLVLDSNPGLGLRAAKDAMEAYERQPSSAAMTSTASASAPSAVHAPSAGFPQAAREALRQGQKITAIKIVREVYGLGLRDAKDLVEAYAERGEAALAGIAPAAATGDLPADAIALILGGHRERASQLLQASHGYSARDAMTAIVACERSRKPRGFGATGGDTVRSGDNNGKMLVVAALVAIVAVVAWYVLAA